MNIESLTWKSVGKFCGVYALLLAGVPQYIGRAKLVSRRVGEHRWERRIKFDDVVAAEVPLDNLPAIERALIRRYRPPFNKKCMPHPALIQFYIQSTPTT